MFFSIGPIDDVEEVHVEQRSWHVQAEPPRSHLFEVQNVVTLGNSRRVRREIES